METTECIDLAADDFDLAEGLYWYCVDFHAGQGSRLYHIQCGLGFRPSPLANGPQSEASSEVYRMLVQGELNAETVLAMIE